MTSRDKRININSMQEVEIKENFARNVKDLRVSRKLNQIQLGEKLSYSSKTISKWEKGEFLPDILTLKMIADFFEIGVDDLISDKNVVRKSFRRRNRLLITIVSSLLVFFVAAIVFYILSLVGVEKSWLSFIVAIPVSAIVLIVFASLWYRRVQVTLSTIYLVIGICLTAMFFTSFHLWWITSLIGGIFIVLAIIFFQIIYSKKHK